MYADTSEKLDLSLHQLKSIKLTHLKFYIRVKKYYNKRKFEFVMLYRKNLIIRNHNTNNFSEATIRILKDIVLCRTKAFNVAALVDYTVNVWDRYYSNRLLNTAYNRCSAYEIFYNKLCQKSEKINISSIKLLERNTYIVPSFKNSNVEYTVNSDVGYCSCPSGRQGGFCKHMAAIHKFFKINFPCAPPITSKDRYELGKLALGSKCPEPEFFLSLRDIDQSEIEISSNILVETQESCLISGDANNEDILSLTCTEKKTNRNL
nr:uncharacterized protein LOC124815742 [Hydra vulgaris]